MVEMKDMFVFFCYFYQVECYVFVDSGQIKYILVCCYEG